MLQQLKIIWFKWIQKKEIFFENEINCIIWENGIWKTNILESIGFLFWSNLFHQNIQDCVNTQENIFFIEWIFRFQNITQTLSISYDKTTKKKNILLNGKKATKQHIRQQTPVIIAFMPLMMNLFYLWPKYRRDFLDNMVQKNFPDFFETLQQYEKIVKHRNKILKNISEQLSNRDEITFWNEELIKYAKIIYEKRLHCINFINEFLPKYIEIFSMKVQTISLKYITKTHLWNIENSMRTYLEKNLERDIILAKTHIWPHLDDFDILLDTIWIDTYASRWETKSIIIALKLLELDYIEHFSQQEAIFLIDDLMSELDQKHKNIILQYLKGHQVILTNIHDIPDILGLKIFI